MIKNKLMIPIQNNNNILKYKLNKNIMINLKKMINFKINKVKIRFKLLI